MCCTAGKLTINATAAQALSVTLNGYSNIIFRRQLSKCHASIHAHSDAIFPTNDSTTWKSRTSQSLSVTWPLKNKIHPLATWSTSPNECACLAITPCQILFRMKTFINILCHCQEQLLYLLFCVPRWWRQLSWHAEHQGLSNFDKQLPNDIFSMNHSIDNFLYLSPSGPHISLAFNIVKLHSTQNYGEVFTSMHISTSCVSTSLTKITLQCVSKRNWWKAQPF